MKLAGLLTSLLTPLWVLAQTAPTATPTSMPGEQVRESLQRCLDFLLKDQNRDGSWGGWRNPGWGDEFWNNIETHRSWTAATTGLVCMAIQEAPATEASLAAYDRGVDYLLEHSLVKRPSEWDTDNVWAYVYALHAVARAYGNPRYESSPRRVELKRVADALLAQLKETQTPSGGWGYYDFEVYANPGAWATSFTTAAAVIAMLDARQAGLEVDARMLDEAVKAVRRCRLPNGAYTYSVEAIPSPGGSEWIDQVKGSLGRIQVCNVALHRAGRDITIEQIREGLKQLFKHHKFLEIARKKPIPHEAYYFNSGYFYFFAQYYAAQAIALLPAAEQPAAWEQLRRNIIKTQEQDGSMWDYYMNSYHKPYGTAFGLMALTRSLAEAK